MKKRQKGGLRRGLSLILGLTLLWTALPVTAAAAAAEEPVLEQSDYYAEGTNSVGRLLAGALEETAEAEGENGVSAVTVSGNAAQVSLHTAAGGTLLAAVYDEESQVMLASGTTEVSPSDTEARIELDMDLPEYFLLRVFLLDGQLSPLCDAYECVEYSKAYADFMAKTTEDFPAERVIDLDGDETNNFMVLKEGAESVQAGEEENILLSADETAGVYIFGKAGQALRGLQPGDIFYYSDPQNPQDIIIIKVGEVRIEGDTVTLTAQETGVPEIFDYVKVDTSGETQDFVMEEGSADEGVTYLGDVDYEPEAETEHAARQPAAYAGPSPRIGGEGSVEKAKKFELKCTSDSGEDSKLSWKIDGGLYLKLKGTFKVLYEPHLFSSDYFEASLVIEASAELSAKIEGHLNLSAKLGELGISPVPGVYAGIRPELKATADVSIELKATLKFAVGASYDSLNGFANKCTPPTFDAKTEAEGKIFLGIDLSPYLNLLGEKFVDFSLTGQVGLHITGKLEGGDSPDQAMRHTCQNCINGELYGEGAITATAAIGKDTWFEHKWTANLVHWTTDKAHFYFSLDNQEFGLGTCPHKQIRITYKVTDTAGQPPFNIEVGGTRTDAQGCCDVYYRPGRHSITVKQTNFEVVTPADGQFELYDPGTVEVVLRYTGVIEPDTPIQPDIKPAGSVVMQWENLTLYENGVAVISGTGAFRKLRDVDKEKMMREQLVGLVVEEGITELGDMSWTIDDYPFKDCKQLQSVSLPASLRFIGDHTFDGCTALRSIVIPENVTKIGIKAFNYCTQLESVSLPTGLLDISYDAFRDCWALQAIRIPENIHWMGTGVFAYCPNITIFGVAGSYAQQYAEQYFVPFVAIDRQIVQPAALGRMLRTDGTQGEYRCTVRGAAAGGRYLLLAMRDAAEDPLAADNLLYAVQQTAEGDSLRFTCYLPASETGQLLVFGPSTPYIDQEADTDTDTDTDTDIEKGDLDGNGSVTIQDVMEACKVLARQSAGKAPTEEEMSRGDLDGDGKFTITDIMEICKILARQA